jgi:hypothetical protein
VDTARVRQLMTQSRDAVVARGGFKLNLIE